MSILALKLLLAILFGAAVGLERESKQVQSSPGGVRTHALIALLGAICGILFVSNFEVLGILVAVVFFVILITYYAIGSYTTKAFGMTSELAILFTFLIGLLPMLNIIPLQFVVALFVALVFILSMKDRMKKIVSGISASELESFISYAIIALVVLPFLPNVGYKLADISFLTTVFDSLNINLGAFADLELINPQKIWIVVALITGIDVLGYTIGKLVGHKGGFSFASIVGGFVSSTSTTVSLAQRSKKSGLVNYLIGAALLANMASFIQLLLLIGPLNAKWLVFIIPSLLIMIVVSGVLGYFFLKRKEIAVSESDVEVKDEKIFSLMAALKFASILIIVKIVTKVCLILFGKTGFVVGSVIASFAGIDAVVVNLAEMAGNVITYKFALITLLFVSATNLLAKTIYSYSQGNRKFANRLSLSFLVIVVCSFAGLLFL